MTLGQRLRQLREHHGLTREDLARKLGVSYWAISKYETGERNPDPSMLRKLADALNCSTDYLLGNDPPSGRDPTSVPVNPKAKRIIDSLARAKELDNEDLEVIADQVERLIEYAKKKKSPKSPPEG